MFALRAFDTLNLDVRSFQKKQYSSKVVVLNNRLHTYLHVVYSCLDKCIVIYMLNKRLHRQIHSCLMIGFILTYMCYIHARTSVSLCTCLIIGFIDKYTLVCQSCLEKSIIIQCLIIDLVDKNTNMCYTHAWTSYVFYMMYINDNLIAFSRGVNMINLLELEILPVNKGKIASIEEHV